ncbi:hypothetical protein NDQ52_13345, partial [Lactiplantibacillus plantarum]|uniref:hypothetical protein n=1 Tax=Lactiplantibacillus plantarum TaxID=1590 RepID=UPI002043336D
DNPIGLLLQRHYAHASFNSFHSGHPLNNNFIPLYESVASINSFTNCFTRQLTISWISYLVANTISDVSRETFISFAAAH